VPLYEITGDHELTPFRRLQGAGLYEREIEELVWTNPDEFLGESLFLVARQPTLPNGGRPDVVALDSAARVVVIEIKRDVDRGQLAQCLEYAGWAMTTSLDELSSLHRAHGNDFFRGWQEFTRSTSPTVINRAPRLVLVAHDFHGRTEAALEFLQRGEVALEIVRVSIYVDEQSRRFLDIEGDREPEVGRVEPGDDDDPIDHTRYQGRRVRITDLLDANLLRPEDELVWERPRVGATYRAKVVKSGAIELDDGRRFASPSRAAIEAANVPACDGWWVWRVERRNGALLNDLRVELAKQRARAEQEANVDAT